MKIQFEHGELLQAKEPSRLDMLRILNVRSDLNKELKEELKILEDTDRNLQLILDYIDEYGTADWMTLKDVFMGLELPNIDLVLLTGAGTYHFRLSRDEDVS